MPLMDNRIIALYSDANDTELDDFNPSKVTVLRYINTATINGHAQSDSIVTKAAEYKLKGAHFTRLEDLDKNVKATLIIDVGAKSKKTFNAAIVLSDLDSSLESTYSLKATCVKK